MLELMLVIAVMAVLVMLSVFAYGDYTKRTRMLEVMLAATPCKAPIFDAYYFGQHPAAGKWGCEASGGTTTYVESVSVDQDGKISVVARGFNDSDIDGKVFTLTPLVNGAPPTFAPGEATRPMVWRCGKIIDGTTVPPQFLPSSCRG